MLRLKIDTKNDAFDNDNITIELKNCLNEVIERIENGFKESNIYDTNGNNVGSWKLTK